MDLELLAAGLLSLLVLIYLLYALLFPERM